MEEVNLMYLSEMLMEEGEESNKIYFNTKAFALSALLLIHSTRDHNAAMDPHCFSDYNQAAL